MQSAGEMQIAVARLLQDGVLTTDEARALAHEASLSGSKDTVKEAAVKHSRHWVRVTRVCNQRCTFCLDSMNHDGSRIDTDALKAYIELGRRMGRERLILSGGEATVHPDFVELIRYGKEVGYDWVQTVTNGMMFAYKGFTRACTQAGLDEATVSMHGHTARLQDRLTGTPGAFVTAIKGMQNLMATDRVVVNIDVVTNKQNYRHLPEIIEYYYNMGIREFDLLHIIPFGRGFDEHRHSLFFDLNDAVPYFRRAFAWADRPDVFLWTNRLPVPYLEDFERLIQDPHKLKYEFDGGRHNFEGYLRLGLVPDCHGERCDYCFLDGACRGTMFPYRQHLIERSFPVVRVDARHAWQGSEAQRAFNEQRPQRLWLTAADAPEAAAALEESPFTRATVTLQLARGADPAPLFGHPRLSRLLIDDESDAARYLLGEDRVAEPLEVEILIDRALAAWLLARPAILSSWGERLIVTLPERAYLSESQRLDPEPAILARLAAGGARLKNVPRCVARAEVAPRESALLDATMLNRSGDLDLDRYVQHFIVSEYHAKSLRCHRCAEFDQCKGLHVNYLRNHGFRVLTPLDADGQPIADARGFEQIADALKKATDARERRERRRLVGMHRPAPAVTEALDEPSQNG